MPASKEFSHEPRSQSLIFLAAVAVAGIMIYPFIVPLILSVITAYVYKTIVKRLDVHTRSYHSSQGSVNYYWASNHICRFVSFGKCRAIFKGYAGFGDKLKEVISAVSNAIAGIGFGTYEGYYIGNVFAAAGIMVFGVVVLTIFIPFILQPYMGAKKSGVSALTILLGFFSGPVIFGAKGLLLGPILFVITETIIVEYMRYRVSEKEGLENSVSEA